MTDRKSVEFDSRDELGEALRRIKRAGGDLSQVLIFTATSPPRLEMAAEVYAAWLSTRDPLDVDDAPVKKTTRKRKSTKSTRGA